MKRTIILMLLGMATLISVANSRADEVVFCVSQEDREAILMDAKTLCVGDQDKYVISGPGIERSEGWLPLVVFSDNQDCKEGSTGTTTHVGFDKNDNGILDTDEVMAVSGACVASDRY